MKNSEIIDLLTGLKTCEDLRGIKFSYAVVKNINLLSREAEPISKMIEKLQIEHAKKDKDGYPVIIEGNYDMVNYNKFNEEFNEFMDLETEIVLHKVAENEIPENISVKQLMYVDKMVIQNPD